MLWSGNGPGQPRERAFQSQEWKAAEGEIARNLSGKCTVDWKALWKVGATRAEGVSVPDRVPGVRVSQASDRGAHKLL
jgi:hypothetical protein